MSRACTEWSPGKVSAAELAHGPELWGGKGYGLMRMCADNLPVPPGFTLSTELCAVYQKNPAVTLEAIKASLPAWLDNLKAHFGYLPLLSVRSGARVSMPGMMDTVLNVGLTTKNREEWAARIGADCAIDSAKRLVHMFKNVVGKDCPDDVTQQILDCIAAVFNSWNSPRAIEYRKLNNIPNEWGTAVTVQAMVFGNMGENSGTGVLFTRDPSTGKPGIVGEFLVNAQGEDVVAGTHKPLAMSENKAGGVLLKKVGADGVNAVVIKALDELFALARVLEAVNGDMQDIEFTIQEGKLWLLQTRAGKRSAAAAFRIVSDMVQDDVLSLEEARKRVTFGQFVTAQRPALDVAKTTAKLGKPVLSGIAGSVGVAVGRAVFCGLHQNKYAGDPQILIRHETTPDDIALMAKSAGILTATGGFTSHAAVVARGMNIPCVTGCDKLSITGDGASIAGPVVGHSIHPGTWVTVDGATGQVWLGQGVTSEDADGVAIKFVQRLADEVGLRIRTSVPASRAYCTAADAPNLTLWAVQARTVRDATLDLRGLSAWVTGKDAEFLEQIGQEDLQGLASAVAALCEVKAQPNVQVVLPDAAPAIMYTRLEKAGYFPVRALNALDDALKGKSTGVFRLGARLKELAGGDDGVAFLREALASKGTQFADDDTGVSLIDAARQLLAA